MRLGAVMVDGKYGPQVRPVDAVSGEPVECVVAAEVHSETGGYSTLTLTVQLREPAEGKDADA